MATARTNVADISSVCHANSFTAPAESSKRRVSRAIVVFRGLALWPPLFFPTQNGCQKITDYRDTAALTSLQLLNKSPTLHRRRKAFLVLPPSAVVLFPRKLIGPRSGLVI